MRPHILLWSPLDDYLGDLLITCSAITSSRIGSAAELAEALPDVDGIVMLGHLYTAEVAALVRDKGARLRWIQLTTAGYDGITFHGVPKTVAVTNAGRSHSPMVAEHAVMLLAALTRRLHLFAEPQSRHVFDRRIALPLATLEGSTVAILGYGGIGRETARRLKGFGAEVLGIARSARKDEFADEVVPPHHLHAVLARADSLVVAAALTEETKGMIDAGALAAMRPRGVLVNIARGGIVDTMALVDALTTGRLAGAGLDVTDPEPPSPDHPLWNCPNLIVTPHVSGLGSPAVRRRIGTVVKENVDVFLPERHCCTGLCNAPAASGPVADHAACRSRGTHRPADPPRRYAADLYHRHNSPVATAILFPGGNGVYAGLRQNFLVRIVPDLARKNLSAIIVDAPPDQAGGMSWSFRAGTEHARDISAVIDFARTGRLCRSGGRRQPGLDIGSERRCDGGQTDRRRDPDLLGLGARNGCSATGEDRSAGSDRA